MIHKPIDITLLSGISALDKPFQALRSLHNAKYIADNNQVVLFATCIKYANVALTLAPQKYTGALINADTISVTAAHPTVHLPEVGHHLDVHHVSLVGHVPHSYEHVISLTVGLDTSAAPSIIPHMKMLEFLELAVFSNNGASSIFTISS